VRAEDRILGPNGPFFVSLDRWQKESRNMPKPQQKLPEISSDINLFEIPRKKPPTTEAAAPPPPAPTPTPHYAQNHNPAAPAVKGDSQSRYWEQKVKEHAAENLKLHQQLDAVTKHRDQLLGVLSNQQQGGAEVEELRTALEAESVNARQLEQQLVHVQHRVQEFNGNLAEKDQEIAVGRQRSAALEHQLTQSTADLSRLRSELDTQAAEHATAMSDLRAQLTEAKQAAEITESSLREQTARARDAAADLSNLRNAHHDLQRQWDENRKSFAELNKRNDELEQRLSDRAGEIQHLRAELDRRGTSYADEFALRARLKDELRHEYNARVAAEQETAAALRRQHLEIQERFNETLKELDELKRRSIEFTNTEAGMAKQMQAAQALADKAQNNYGREAARANKLEKTLETLKQNKEELQEKLGTERKEATKFRRKAELLEKRLLKKRGSTATDFGDPGDLDLRVRDSVSALAKATADLEAERRRLESTALHSRLPSLDATRVGQAFVNSLRSQLRPSADNLMNSIRRLLESSLELDQQRIVETAFENAIVIQAALQEGQSQSESNG